MAASGAPGSAAIYRRLLTYTRPYWGLGVAAVVGMAVEAGAAGAFTALMEPMIDKTFIARDAAAVGWLPLAIVALFVLRGIATYTTDYGMARMGRGVVQILRQQILEKFLRLPSSYFDRESTAALTARITYHTEQVAQASSDAVKIALTDVLTLIALVAVMLWQSVKITITMLVIGPLIAAIVGVVGRRYRRINQGIQTGIAQLAQVAEQSISGQQIVKVYGAQADEAARFAKLAERNRKLQVKVESTKALSSSVVQLLAAVALAIILWIAGSEAAAGRLQPGQFVSLMTAMMAMLPSLKRITNVQGMIQKGVAAAGGLFEIIDQPEEVDRGSRPLERASGRVEFERVSVNYGQGSDAALSDLSFVAEPGTVTAVVGRSGSGKTTLVRLLPRFYEPSAGQVRLDGVDLVDYRLADLRRQIALVSQELVLFDDSVAANIAFGQPTRPSQAELEKAAAAANALEFIRRLPQGFDTPIGEKGALLSGGQRQRLAIARAILKDAPILILDEATSALDTESERLIQEALERLMVNRTTFVIAHRLSTIERAHRVLVLDQGRLLESGTHAELLARGGAYAHLHQLQFAGQNGAGAVRDAGR